MPPESEAGQKASINLLLELVREQQATQRERSVMLRALDNRLDGMIDDMAWVKARIAHLPQPAGFCELRGRVEEIRRRRPHGSGRVIRPATLPCGNAHAGGSPSRALCSAA
ncbi:MAG TPA: hypothetical protein VD995_30370 [Azospirillum sp.]|nr:hypothetical protein [Azospirillum sp.]